MSSLASWCRTPRCLQTHRVCRRLQISCIKSCMARDSCGSPKSKLPCLDPVMHHRQLYVASACKCPSQPKCLPADEMPRRCIEPSAVQDALRGLPSQPCSCRTGWPVFCPQVSDTPADCLVCILLRSPSLRGPVGNCQGSCSAGSHRSDHDSLAASHLACLTALASILMLLPMPSKPRTSNLHTSPDSLCTLADMPAIPDAPAPTSGAEVSEHAQLAWLHELALYLDPALSLPELAQSGRTLSELQGRIPAETSAGSGDAEGPALSASACFQALLVHATPAAAKVGLCHVAQAPAQVLV